MALFPLLACSIDDRNLPVPVTNAPGANELEVADDGMSVSGLDDAAQRGSPGREPTSSTQADPNASLGGGASLAFSVAPQAAVTDVLMDPVAVEIVDTTGTRVDATVRVTLGIGENPGGAKLRGLVSEVTRGGLASFALLGVDQPGDGYTLVASAEGFSNVDSEPFDVRHPSFSRVATGLYGGVVMTVAFSNGAPNVSYASGAGGVFRSTNGGATWTAANFGNPGSAGRVVTDPHTPTTLYVTPAFDSKSFGGPQFGFMGKSVDGGETWRSLSSLAGRAGQLLIHPDNPSILYAGWSNGIVKSTDAGENWSAIGFAFSCTALAMDPLQPSVLYAGAYDAGTQQFRGGYKSIDGGTSFSPVAGGDLGQDEPITGLFATPGAVYAHGTAANLYRSVDGGASWALLPIPGWLVAHAPSAPGRHYLGVGRSVHVSNDEGRTFSAAVDTGGGLINSLSVHPTDPDRVYAATDDGVFASSDGGASWSAASTGISTLPLQAVALDPRDPSRVIVGGPGGLYRSTNASTVWNRIELGAPASAVAFDATGPQSVYACAGELQHSEDGGETWVAGAPGVAGCDHIAAAGQRVWLTIPFNDAPIYQSTDGGATLEPATLPGAGRAVALSPDGLSVYAATDDGTFRSTDGGSTWTQMTLDLADDLALDPDDPNTVYMALPCGVSPNDGAAQSGVGVRRSTDAGVTWQPARGPCADRLSVPRAATVLSINRLGGLSVSRDAGDTWQSGGDGIRGEVAALAAGGDTVYVATLLGLYRSDTGGP